MELILVYLQLFQDMCVLPAKTHYIKCDRRMDRKTDKWTEKQINGQKDQQKDRWWKRDPNASAKHTQYIFHTQKVLQFGVFKWLV